MNGSVLFLDIATTLGWCQGVPGGKPASGSLRLAPVGADHDAIHGGMVKWLMERLRSDAPPDVIVYETPIDPRHMGKRTTFKTSRVLIGLCGVAEGVANRMGYTGQNRGLFEVEVRDIRKHFLPPGSPRTGSEVKRAVVEQCRVLGFDPADDNEADAIAGWHYASALFVPSTAAATTPLLGALR